MGGSNFYSICKLIVFCITSDGSISQPPYPLPLELSFLSNVCCCTFARISPVFLPLSLFPLKNGYATQPLRCACSVNASVKGNSHNVPHAHQQPHTTELGYSGRNSVCNRSLMLLRSASRSVGRSVGTAEANATVSVQYVRSMQPVDSSLYGRSQVARRPNNPRSII